MNLAFYQVNSCLSGCHSHPVYTWLAAKYYSDDTAIFQFRDFTDAFSNHRKKSPGRSKPLLHCDNQDLWTELQRTWIALIAHYFLSPVTNFLSENSQYNFKITSSGTFIQSAMQNIQWTLVYQKENPPPATENNFFILHLFEIKIIP